MFLLRSSAVDGTYSLELVFFFPLLGINSLTHSPLAAAISLKNDIVRHCCLLLDSSIIDLNMSVVCHLIRLWL